ncbi:MerR family transcriptional regulator [Haloechinothrix halophila]|uniref:MerR family transcriptional regulator n=1 Tax=Haloechinothrix halophila TaxID=1069073 RepID=UPI00040D4286|nr:MerR family transcriptional regulator [Haloechinothrix halophila]
MRIAELSRQAGVSIPTIKYYLREGLLPPGERTNRNQAQYDEPHLERLRLIRALIDVGKLPVATVREVLATLDEPDISLHKVLGTVSASLSEPTASTPDDDLVAAREDVDALIERHGWQIAEDTPELDVLAGIIVRARQLGHAHIADSFDTYCEAAESIADVDVGYVSGLGTVENVVEGVVVGTVLGDAALAAIRRLAHQNLSARRFAES